MPAEMNKERTSALGLLDINETDDLAIELYAPLVLYHLSNVSRRGVLYEYLTNIREVYTKYAAAQLETRMPSWSSSSTIFADDVFDALAVCNFSTFLLPEPSDEVFSRMMGAVAAYDRLSSVWRHLPETTVSRFPDQLRKVVELVRQSGDETQQEERTMSTATGVPVEELARRLYEVVRDLDGFVALAYEEPSEKGKVRLWVFIERWNMGTEVAIYERKIEIQESIGEEPYLDVVVKPISGHSPEELLPSDARVLNIGGN